MRRQRLLVYSINMPSAQSSAKSSCTFPKPHIGLSPRKLLGVDGTLITLPPPFALGYLVIYCCGNASKNKCPICKNVPEMNQSKLNLSEPSHPGLKEASSDSDSNFHRNCVRTAQQSLRRSSGSETNIHISICTGPFASSMNWRDCWRSERHK